MCIFCTINDSASTSPAPAMLMRADPAVPSSSKRLAPFVSTDSESTYKCRSASAAPFKSSVKLDCCSGWPSNVSILLAPYTVILRRLGEAIVKSTIISSMDKTFVASMYRMLSRTSAFTNSLSSMSGIMLVVSMVDCSAALLKCNSAAPESWILWKASNCNVEETSPVSSSTSIPSKLIDFNIWGAWSMDWYKRTNETPQKIMAANQHSMVIHQKRAFGPRRVRI